MPDCVAMRERRADRDRRVHAGHDVGDRDAHALRPAARHVVALAGDAHHAAHALDHEVVAGALAVRPGLAEAGDRAVDEARIDRLQVVVAEAVAREVADLVVLDQHVALRGELAHDRLALRLREIDGDRLLAAVGRGEVRRLLRVPAVRVLQPRRAEGARVVAGLRALDLDHLGAEIGEVLPAHGAASTRERSSTRMPASGPAMSALPPHQKFASMRRANASSVSENTMRSCRTGSRCASRAPSGASGMLVATIRMRPGR